MVLCRVEEWSATERDVARIWFTCNLIFTARLYNLDDF